MSEYSVTVYDSSDKENQLASQSTKNNENYDGSETTVSLKINTNQGSRSYYVVVSVNDGAATAEQGTSGPSPDLRPPSSVGRVTDGFASVAGPVAPSLTTPNSGEVGDFCVARGSSDVRGGFVGGPTAVQQNAAITYDDSLNQQTIVAPGELVVPPIAHLHLSVTELDIESD